MNTHVTWNGQLPRLDQKTAATLCGKRVPVRHIRHGSTPSCVDCRAILAERAAEFNRLYQAGKREVSR